MKKGKPQMDSNARVEDSLFVAIDTEPAGLNERRDSLMSVGPVRKEGIVRIAFYRLINPGSGLTADSVRIYGITPSEVESKPGSGKVLREFLDYCGTDIIVLSLGFA